jgi:uncharacterized membrane protein YdjX (TVP38/TMEM64 family)
MPPQGRWRLLLLLLAILALWTTAWATGLTERFTREGIQGFVAGKGAWGVAAFVAVFAAGQLLRVPSFVFLAAAVAAYGRERGIPVALLGALVSAAVSFAVVRVCAGQALAGVERPVVGRLLRKIDRRPVLTVALLRLIFQTAPPLNYALPMTTVRWRDHLLGSALGLPAPVAAMAMVFDWLLH